jgi:hypothetical protein
MKNKRKNKKVEKKILEKKTKKKGKAKKKKQNRETNHCGLLFVIYSVLCVGEQKSTNIILKNKEIK